MKTQNIFTRFIWLFKGKHCSFCGKHHSAVAKLIAGPVCSICNDCVLICSGVLMKESDEYRKAQIEMVRAIPRALDTATPSSPLTPPAQSSGGRA